MENEEVEVIDGYSGNFLTALGYFTNGVNDLANEFNEETEYSKIVRLEAFISNADGGEEKFVFVIDADGVNGVVLP